MSINQVPTVQHHLHWEAAIPEDTIAELAQRNEVSQLVDLNGNPLSGVDPQNPDSLRKYTESISKGFKTEGGFIRFLTAFRALASVIKRPEDIELAIFRILKAEQQAGSIHTELRGSPMSMLKPTGASIDEIFLAVRSGIDRAYDELGMSSAFIASFSRDKGMRGGDDPLMNQAKHVVAAVIRHHTPDTPVGLDIAGAPENIYPPAMFEKALAPAVEAGVTITIHAGEQGTPETDFRDAPPGFVRDAIEKFGAKRVGHGTSIIADSELIALVRDTGTGVETCPTSNDIMGQMPLAQHPVKQFLDERIKATLNTDDPLFFGSRDVREILTVHASTLGLTVDDAIQMARYGVETAFLSEKRKAELSKKLDSYTLAT